MPDTFDFGILSSEELPNEDMDAIDFLLEGNSPEKITSKEATKDVSRETTKETTKPPEVPKPETPPKEELKEEDLENLLGMEKEEKKVEEEEEEGNPYPGIAHTLFEQGILSFEGEQAPDIETPQQLLEAFQQEGRKNASQVLNTFLEKFGPDRREAFDALFVHGVDPREYFTTLTHMEDFSDLDLEDEPTQEQVAREYLRRQGWKDNSITKTVQLWKEAGELGDYSKGFQQELIEKDQESLRQSVEQEKRKKAEESRIEQEYQTNIQNILREKLKSKDFDGIPVNEKIARQALDDLSKKSWRLGNREITEWDKFILDLNKPENHSLKVKLALLKANNFDFSVLTKKAVSKETNTLFGELKTKTAKSKKEALQNEEEPFWV